MAELVKLSPRKNQIQYSPDEVREVAELILENPAQAVAWDMEVQETEAKARNRARIMAEAIAERFELPDGKKIRTHSTTHTDGDKSGFIPAVSLRDKKDKDEATVEGEDAPKDASKRGRKSK